MAITVATLCSITSFAAPQEDWAKLFDELNNPDRAISDAARARIATGLLPRLCDEPQQLVTAEIPGLVDQLNQAGNDKARQQAAAFLLVIAQYRGDSAIVLSAALPALIEHAQNDALAEIKRNCTVALSLLNPGIPEEALRALLTAMRSTDPSTMPIAVYGVARVANTSPKAAAAMDEALSDSGPRRLVAIKAMGAANVTNAQLVSRLGPLLANQNEDVVRAALEALDKLGAPAVKLNAAGIGRLAETSSNQDFVKLARDLLARAGYG